MIKFRVDLPEQSSITWRGIRFGSCGGSSVKMNGIDIGKMVKIREIKIVSIIGRLVNNNAPRKTYKINSSLPDLVPVSLLSLATFTMR